MIPAKETYYINLPLSIATDAELSACVAAIRANAPNSVLYQSDPVIQSTVTTVLDLATAWKDASDVVSGDENKLATDKKLRDANRNTLTQKLRLLRSQIQDAAPTAAAARSLGVNTRDAITPPSPLLAPTGGTLTPNYRVRGQFKATVNAVPGIRTYAMQISPDPMREETFVNVDGTGKSRILKGYASGTRWWMRFAATRGRAQSEWSPPVSILVP